MSTMVPPLYAGLVDDASLLPPSPIVLADAVAKYDEHAASWYAGLIGSLLVPASVVGAGPLPRARAGLIGDVPAANLPMTVEKLRAAGLAIEHVEAAVARRGEDPQPGLAALRAFAARQGDIRLYAEIPLSWGLLAALDSVAEARVEGLAIAPKFRVGGLAAELFPTPVELAAVICACRDRDLPFKLAAGLRHATRHTDPETGFTHHGFLNVLIATVVAAEGGEVADVAEALAATHPVPLVEPARTHRDAQRPLFVGFGAANVVEPLTELVRLGLINGGYE
ncbi:hypothetical protein AMIS_77480 [Actinoplanes missouriensis 431]|uniref:Uncharacterized protein n=1 Tax=Actinoplanes missouriensis (strain ATCC 14538 / DSM 43046 / CBS 188.64 / JCM 3121 / NBRC 102363 / NCIMB 12654 / NRRL B-3342 / UNCC 431) TaxID=512565 RepID=I0HIY1_ACTM4|nr:hypothetical protein [Actinoplanes missouriensis]BAL92968.1 hypothetical protein AMIS_77480 [Actinoplanes missouriensis 431]